MQMAREYQSAALLIHKELSADLRSGGADRLGRGAEQDTRRHPGRIQFKAGQGLYSRSLCLPFCVSSSLPPHLPIARRPAQTGFMRLSAGLAYGTDLAAPTRSSILLLVKRSGWISDQRAEAVLGRVLLCQSAFRGVIASPLLRL